MQFGPVPVDQAQGAILAHSVELPKGRMRKGQVLDAAAVVALAAAGLAEVVVARLSPTDLPEDEAASRLASALVSDPEGQGLALSTATTGPVTTVRPHASAVSWLSNRFWLPPPTTRIVSSWRPVDNPADARISSSASTTQR